MKEHNQLKHRGKGTAAKRKKPRSLKATAANEIYFLGYYLLIKPDKGTVLLFVHGHGYLQPENSRLAGS